MRTSEQKKEIKKVTADLDALVSRLLLKLTATAYQVAKAQETKQEIKDLALPGPLRLNRLQVRKYQIYEFFLSPDDVFNREIAAIFTKAFPDEKEPEQIFNDLHELLPDGVSLYYTSEESSPLPRYEFHGRKVLLSIRLAAEKFLSEKVHHKMEREIILAHVNAKCQKRIEDLERLYSEFFNGCSLMSSDQEPDPEHLQEHKIAANAVIILHGAHVYYLNQANQTRERINLSTEQFTLLMKNIGKISLKNNQPKKLSDAQLSAITKIISYPFFPTPKLQLQQLKKIIYGFQNDVRAQLIDIVSKNDIPTEAHLHEISESLFDYELRGQFDPSYGFDRVESELTCDLFRLHQFTEDRLQFQSYFRHFPLTISQQKMVEKKSEEFKDPVSTGRLLYPTGSAHSNALTLPNFANVIEGTYENSKFAVVFSGFRHGTPIDLRRPTREMKQEEAAKYKHHSIYLVFNNYCQELMILRSQKIQRIFLEYNESAFEPKFTLPQIQRLSLQLSASISADIDAQLLLGNVDMTGKALDIVNKALKLTDLAKYRRLVLFLKGYIQSIFKVQNFYTHIISGHDDTHLSDNPDIKTWAGFPVYNWGKQQDGEAPQFRTCRIVQYALDYSEKDFGISYLCLPLNFPDQSAKILGNLRSGLIQAFLKMQSAFPEDNLVKSAAKVLKDLDLQKNYYRLRSSVSSAAKKYVAACAPDSSLSTEKLSEMRKNEFKEAEQQFFNFLATSKADLMQIGTKPFKTLSEAVIDSEPSTLPGIILKVIFQIFDDGNGEWRKNFKGVIPALFQFFTHHMNRNPDIAVSSSGGCKSANDRWQRVALILTAIVQKGISRDLLKDLEQALKNFGDDVAFNLSRVHTSLEGSTIPKTQPELIFNKLKSTAKPAKGSPAYKLILEVMNAACLVLCSTLPVESEIESIVEKRYQIAYIRYKSQLFFADKKRNSLEEIKIEKELLERDFDGIKRIPPAAFTESKLHSKCIDLSNRDLQLIRALLKNHKLPNFLLKECERLDPNQTAAQAINAIIFTQAGAKILGPLSGAIGSWAHEAIGFCEIVGTRYLYERSIPAKGKSSPGQQDEMSFCYLDQFPTDEKQIVQFFIDKFKGVGRELENKFPDLPPTAPSLLKTSGACLILAVIDTINRTISLGNQGDGTLYLITLQGGDEYTIELLNELDRPDHPEEAERAKTAGGIITGPSRFDSCWRLGGLAVTATFGDQEIKGIRRYPKTRASIPYRPNSYAILACDGLSEYFSSEEIKAFLISLIKAPSASKPQSWAWDLSRQGFELGSTDNMSTMVIDLDELEAKNPGKIFQLGVADGHGLEAHKISHVICSALKNDSKLAPTADTDQQDAPFNYKKQCKPFESLAIHKRHKDFKEASGGFLPIKQFNELWAEKIPGFHVWRYGIMPKNPIFKNIITPLFFNYCQEQWWEMQQPVDKEKKYATGESKSLSSLKKALIEINLSTENERLALEWLNKYFERPNLLANENIIPSLKKQDSDKIFYDDEDQIDSDSEYIESKSVKRPVNRYTDEIVVFFYCIKEYLSEVLPEDTELLPLVDNLNFKKLGARMSGDINIKRADWNKKCQILFKLMDKSYQLKIKSLSVSSFLSTDVSSKVNKSGFAKLSNFDKLVLLCNSISKISLLPEHFVSTLVIATADIQSFFQKRFSKEQEELDEDYVPSDALNVSF